MRREFDDTRFYACCCEALLGCNLLGPIMRPLRSCDNICAIVADRQKITAEGKPTKSAHPARFSPDDKFSRHRVTIKKR